MSMSKYNRQELAVYGLLWFILFLAPVLGQYASAFRGDETAFEWAAVVPVWHQLGLFFSVFLIHNFLLAPLLVEQRRRWLYFSLVVVLLAVFVLVQCSSRPDGPKGGPDRSLSQNTPPPPHGGERPEDASFGAPSHDGRPAFEGEHRHMGGPGKPGPREPRFNGERPPILGQYDAVAFIIMLLMLGVNLGVKSFFRQRADRERLAQLEKQNLEQQLEYLRYQINPHFLMNTLNNIHALIDIDGERAKESILQLSKIMRFMLYEGAKQLVPLSRELTFTQDYIGLMRMRLTDRVKVSVSMPQQVPDSQIPPLVLITFVENAFKHGVSYRQESFISMAVQVADSQLHFTCRNSKIPKTDEQHGGVGLQNVKQRLDLIYGNGYTLKIADLADIYDVSLTLPLLPS